MLKAKEEINVGCIVEMYIRLLGYLRREPDLGVLLVGLDAVHAVIESLSGSPIAGPTLQHLVGVIAQADAQLDRAAAVNPELAAVWLLAPMRLAKLYQLRCAAGLESCDQRRQIDTWLRAPNALSADLHQQASCL